jgi:hypothetical protein
MYGTEGEGNCQRIRATGPARDEEQRRLRIERRALRPAASHALCPLEAQGNRSAAHLGSLSARSDVAGDEGSSESEGSGQESSEDETITDPALLFPILDMSERLRLSADNLSKGLQSNGNGKLWKKAVPPINPNRPGAPGHKERTAMCYSLRVQHGPFGPLGEPQLLPPRSSTSYSRGLNLSRVEAILDSGRDAARTQRYSPLLAAADPRIQQKFQSGDAMSKVLRAMNSAASTMYIQPPGSARLSHREAVLPPSSPSPAAPALVRRHSDVVFPVPQYVLPSDALQYQLALSLRALRLFSHARASRRANLQTLLTNY